MADAAQLLPHLPLQLLTCHPIPPPAPAPRIHDRSNSGTITFDEFIKVRRAGSQPYEWNQKVADGMRAAAAAACLSWTKLPHLQLRSS